MLGDVAPFNNCVNDKYFSVFQGVFRVQENGLSMV